MTESLNLPDQLTMTESQLYNNIIEKLDKIKYKINDLKNYSNNFETKKNINFLEKFNDFSLELNNLKSSVDDMYKECLFETDPDQLSAHDRNERNNLLIEKKIQNTFLPYMLYLQIMLTNSNDLDQ
jgi:hypothetical protein